MVKIPVVVVDDNEADRYIAVRNLTKFEEFDNVHEYTDGVSFLEDFFDGRKALEIEQPPLIILMDINMPRMNGFETVRELLARQEDGHGPEQIAVVMFTSSDNPDDHKEAEILNCVQGYIVKPLDKDGIDRIREVYFNAA